jgi:hypothetical protein
LIKLKFLCCEIFWLLTPLNSLDERAEAELQHAETLEQENNRLREQLRALGVDPDALL